MSIRGGVLDDAVLHLLKTSLLQPEAVAQFIKTAGGGKRPQWHGFDGSCPTAI
jgi:hypothetical protein